MRIVKIFLFTLSILLSATSVSAKTYPDPQYKKADLASLGTFAAPTNVSLDIHFQRNGKPMEKVVKQVRPLVEKHLLSTHAYAFVNDAAAPVLRITLNNVADLDEARKKGFLTGLTFGGKGSTITDYYEAKIELVKTDETLVKEYKHALVTTIGRAPPPFEGVASMKPMLAFDVVVQDIMLNFVQDMKTDGKLGANEEKAAIAVPAPAQA
ncbi:MAG: hypothetical protein ACRERV_18565, partial [Methylococcales bacterium]